jgi:hypothetical protein
MSAANIVVGPAVEGFFHLMRRWRRRSLAQENRRWDRPDPLAAGRSLEALKRDYRGYDIVATPLFFLLVPALVFVWADIFQAVGAWAAPDPGPAGRLLGPPFWAWYLPALFAAIPSGGWICFLLLRLMLGARFGEYVFYSSKLAGFDVLKVFKTMSLAFAVLVTFAVALFALTYAAFLDDRIVVKGVFAEPRGYAYNELVAIRAVAGRPARDGKTSDARPGHFEMLFRDGSLWRSTDGLRDSFPRCDYLALALAAQRARLRIAGPDILSADRSGADCS